MNDRVPEFKIYLPSVPLVVLTGIDNVEAIFFAFMRGVSGYLIMPLPATEVQIVLQDVLKRGVGMCLRVQQSFANALKNCGLLTRSHGLSQRENQVIACLLSGASNKEIAESLCLSPDTVHVHLGRIFRKLKMHSRSQVVQYLLDGCETVKHTNSSPIGSSC
jgi:two-component system nitrate/nitrite response regulator NarL